MLGRGRPFLVEVLNPRTRDLSPEVFEKIEQLINTKNEKVTVRDVQPSNKKDVTTLIREGETEKTKCYDAYCCSDRPLTAEDVDRIRAVGQNIVIKQKTPIRVLHR